MKKNYFKLFWWVLKLQLSVSKFFTVWKLLYAVYDGASTIVVVYLTANLINSVTRVALSDEPTSSVYRWLILIFAFEVFMACLSVINRLLEVRFRQKIGLKTNMILMTKIYELSQEQFENQEFNTKFARAREGLLQVESAINEVTWLVSSFVRLIGSLVAIVVITPLVGIIICLLIIPLTFIKAKENRYMEKVYRDMEPIERVAFRTRWMLIDPQYMIEIRLANGFKALIAHWRKNMVRSNHAYLAMEKKTELLSLIQKLIEPLVYFASVWHYFTLLVANTIGLETFLFLRSLTEQAVNSVGSLSGSFGRMDELLINIGNFMDVQVEKPTIPKGSVDISPPLTIEFKDVSFSYPNSSDCALSHVSFILVPGSKLAIVGENGAGKSTLIKLLQRQYLPTSGQILVNGIPIEQVSELSLYKQLGSLSQEFLMISHLSIQDNLTLGVDEKVLLSDIKRVLSLAGAEFVLKLPHGVKTRLDSSFKDGTSLSGGQQQRIGVARALLRGGDVLLLDEPTSAIDAKAEFKIFNNIYEAHAGKTTLIISHRFSTVRKADKIIVMENGKITEYGSHDELLAYAGTYKEMFDLQAEGYR